MLVEYPKNTGQRNVSKRNHEGMIRPYQMSNPHPIPCPLPSFPCQVYSQNNRSCLRFKSRLFCHGSIDQW